MRDHKLGRLQIGLGRSQLVQISLISLCNQLGTCFGVTLTCHIFSKIFSYLTLIQVLRKGALVGP